MQIISDDLFLVDLVVYFSRVSFILALTHRNQNQIPKSHNHLILIDFFLAKIETTQLINNFHLIYESILGIEYLSRYPR